MERLALREEGKEACARAEVSETAEMGGETVERVKPLCTCFERAILKRERWKACAGGGGGGGCDEDGPTGTFYHVTRPLFTPLLLHTPLHTLSFSSS